MSETRTNTATKTDPGPVRIDLAPDDVGAGLAQVVLIVLRLLHELLERQAIRKVDGGTLSDQQVEDLGSTLQQARGYLDHLQTLLVADAATVNNPIGQNEDHAKERKEQ